MNRGGCTWTCTHTHKRSQQFEQKQLAAWECQCGTFLMAMPCMPSSPTCYTPCWVSNEWKCRQNVPADSGLSYQWTEEHSALLPTHRLSRSRGITADIAESIRVLFLYFNRLNRLRKKTREDSIINSTEALIQAGEVLISVWRIDRQAFAFYNAYIRGSWLRLYPALHCYTTFKDTDVDMSWQK